MIRRTTTRSVAAIVGVSLICATLTGFASAPLLPMATQRFAYVVNNTNEPLVVTSVHTTPNPWNYDVFEGLSPQVGDVIQPNETYAFEVIKYFFANQPDVKISVRNQNSTGHASVSRGSHASGCQASGTIACANKTHGILVQR